MCVRVVVSHYFKTEREVADCTASLMKSDTAFEHAVPGKKTKIKRMTKKTEKENVLLLSVWLKVEVRHLERTLSSPRPNFCAPLPSPTLYHALHVKKIALIHQTKRLRLHDHSDKTHCICSLQPRMKRMAMHKQGFKSHKGRESHIVPLI